MLQRWLSLVGCKKDGPATHPNGGESHGSKKVACVVTVMVRVTGLRNVEMAGSADHVGVLTIEASVVPGESRV